jgi:hypothetical protein
MADQGSVGRVQGQSPLAPSARAADVTPGRLLGTGTAGQGAGRREVTHAQGRQSVELDGKAMNRTARRGTYLNIVV